MEAGQYQAASRDELSSLLLEELGPAPIGELLDIGTGSGLMLEILGPRARRAVWRGYLGAGAATGAHPRAWCRPVALRISPRRHV